MGKIRNKALKFLFCFFSGIICGAILGSTIISVLVSYRMDQFYEKIALLENTIADKNEKLDKLEKSVNKSNFVIKDIKVILNFDGDEFDKIEVQKAIKEKYNSLIGKEVKDIDSDILIEVLDKRILRINDDDYQLNVTKIVLTQVLTVWVDILKIQ
ncbi:MAG: hypothetical protein K0Q97_1123 [Bacillota bacterium]|jgi:hypothetical protein|nr:hypothetical protein [Bacillota bacterium]